MIQAINALDRSVLNNALLDELERAPNVKLFFNHKLTGADFRTNKAWFERRIPGDTPQPDNLGVAGRVPEIEVSFDYLLGADGAHSASRFHMMKFARVDYQQEYIDTLWCEFRIPPTEDGNFRISPNHLHIWPGRGSGSGGGSWPGSTGARVVSRLGRGRPRTSTTVRVAGWIVRRPCPWRRSSW